MIYRAGRLYYRLRELRGVPIRTLTAMFAYWLSGRLHWIRYPQRTYLLDFAFEDDDGELAFPEPTKGPRHMMTAPWVTNLMIWSTNHDPEHSDHWSLDHLTCGNRRFAYECPTCKGMVCMRWIGPGMPGPDDEDDSIHAFTP